MKCMIVNAFLWIGQNPCPFKASSPSTQSRSFSWCCCAYSLIKCAHCGDWFLAQKERIAIEIFCLCPIWEPTIEPKSDKLVWILVKYAQVHQYLIDKSAAQLYVVYIGTNSMTNMSLSLLQILMTYT